MARITSITLNGKEYPMSFSLMAIKQMTKKYGNLEKCFAGLKDTEVDEKTIDLVAYILALLIAQGCAYKNNFEKDVPIPDNAPVEDGKWKALTQEQIEILLLGDEIDTAVEKISECISGGKEKELATKSNGKKTEAEQE